MKELQKLKPLAEQFFTLSVQLLEAIDADEQEYARFIESVKKTLTEKFYIFLRLRRIRIKKIMQAYISPKRSLKLCQKI